MTKYYADPPLPGYLPLPIPKEEEPYITLVKHGENHEAWVVELPDKK